MLSGTSIGEVKYQPIDLQHSNTKYQGTGLPSIGIEQTITIFSLKKVSSENLVGKGIILYLEQIKLEVGSGTTVISIRYGNFDGLVANTCTYSIWEIIW